VGPGGTKRVWTAQTHTLRATPPNSPPTGVTEEACIRLVNWPHKTSGVLGESGGEGRGRRGRTRVVEGFRDAILERGAVQPFAQTADSAERSRGVNAGALCSILDGPRGGSSRRRKGERFAIPRFHARLLATCINEPAVDDGPRVLRRPNSPILFLAKRICPAKGSTDEGATDEPNKNMKASTETKTSSWRYVEAGYANFSSTHTIAR